MVVKLDLENINVCPNYACAHGHYLGYSSIHVYHQPSKTEGYFLVNDDTNRIKKYSVTGQFIAFPLNEDRQVIDLTDSERKQYMANFFETKTLLSEVILPPEKITHENFEEYLGALVNCIEAKTAQEIEEVKKQFPPKKVLTS